MPTIWITNVPYAVGCRMASQETALTSRSKAVMRRSQPSMTTIRTAGGAGLPEHHLRRIL